MGQLTLGQQIDAFARENKLSLKGMGKNTKLEVAQYMVMSGVISENDFNTWLNDEGKTHLTQEQKAQLQSGVSAFTVAGYNDGTGDYLESLDFKVEGMFERGEQKRKLENLSEYVKSTPATKQQKDTNNIILARYSQALKDFNAQLANDGWAGDVADAMGRIWGNNYADAVREDLKICKKQYEELVEASKESEEEYKAKFKEIYGVEYKATNVIAYQKAEERYIEASKAKVQEDNFKSEFNFLLNCAELQDEKTTVKDKVNREEYEVVTATKQQVFDREFKRLANAMGEQGESILKEKFKQAEVENKSIDEKFKVLQTLAKTVSMNLEKSTMLATGGVSYETIENQRNNCYNAAFGSENDIQKRVTDYNISQQKGAGVVKGATVMAIVTACALTGQVEGIVAVAGVAAGTTAAVEVTDAASQKRNLDALRKDGLEAYIKSVGKNTDWGSIAQASLSSGAMMLAIGGISYPIANLCRIGASSVGLTGKALDIATGLSTNTVVTGGVLGSQYLMKGEITTEDAVFAVVMAVVGSTIQVLQINKAYAKAESAAVDAHVQNIQDARRTLGFEDGVEITPEMLKQQYKKMALANHPDKGGSNVNMAVINSAKDYLQAHLADINIGLTGAKPQSINPTVEAARGNTKPQSPVTTDNSLAKSGFSDELVTELTTNRNELEQATWKTFFERVQILNEKVNSGVNITRDLIETTLFKDNIYSEGFVDSYLRTTLAKYWIHGKEVYNAYGELAPGQSRFSLGGINATKNRVIHSVKDFVDDVQFELGLGKYKSKAQASAVQSNPKTYQATVPRPTAENPQNIASTTANSSRSFAEAMELAKLNPERFRVTRNLYGDKTGNMVNITETRADGVVELTTYDSQTGQAKGGMIAFSHDDVEIGFYPTENKLNIYAPGQKINLTVEVAPESFASMKAQLIDILKSSTPENINKAVELLNSKGAGLWRAIQEPLTSTEQANPEAFGVKSQQASSTQTSATQDFATKLASYKGPDGKQLLSSEDISNLLKNNKGLGGEPIKNFEAKIEAVLSNPEEVADISGWESKSAGVWRAIQDPLNSTVKANPEAFGVKTNFQENGVGFATKPMPKGIKQTAPSCELPKVVDRIYGNKAEAEAIVFGNGKISEIKPEIVQDAIKDLSNYLNREIKVEDLQVIRTSNGSYISYFDSETNLATHFSISGKLNGQFKVEFDTEGNIKSFDLETIYADGEFYIK